MAPEAPEMPTIKRFAWAFAAVTGVLLNLIDYDTFCERTVPHSGARLGLSVNKPQEENSWRLNRGFANLIPATATSMSQSELKAFIPPWMTSS
jgi:hypothetical protein